MMKKMSKKVLTLALVLVMVFAFSAVAAAADGAIGVTLDDKAVNLGTAAAISQNDTTYVPVKAVGEALGAKVTAENLYGRKEAVRLVRGDVDLLLVVGEKEMAVSCGNDYKKVQLKAAPILIYDTVYVPVRPVAEALGFCVGWSNQPQTVKIVDVEKLCAKYADKFTIVDKYLQYSVQFAQKNYAVTADYQANIAMSMGAEKPMSFKMTGTMDGLLAGNNGELSMAIKMDLKDLEAMLTPAEKADPSTAEMLKMLGNIKMDYIINMDEGLLYLRSDMLTSGLGMPAGTWISLDMKEIMGAASEVNGMEMPLDALLSLSTQTTTVGALQSIMQLAGAADQDYAEIESFMDECVKLFGDATFTKEGSNYIWKKTFEEEGMSFYANIVLKTSFDKVVAYDISMGIEEADAMGIMMKMNMDANNKGTAKIYMKMQDLMDMNMTMNMKYTESVRTPAKAPAKGEPVMDLMKMFESLATGAAASTEVALPAPDSGK